MTVTTFSELELDENLLSLQIKVSLARQPFRPPLFRLRSMAVTSSVQRRPALVKRRRICCQRVRNRRFPRKKSGPPRILIHDADPRAGDAGIDHARELAKHTHLDIATITGGVAYMNHAEVFSENQDIVVATTGRLLQYKEENFDCRAVGILILDEADRMLTWALQSRNHRQKPTGASRPAAVSHDARRRCDQRLRRTSSGGAGAGSFTANPSTRERKKIHQWYYRADDIEHKTKLLVNLLQQPEATRAIVFVRKRERVHELANWLP